MELVSYETIELVIEALGLTISAIGLYFTLKDRSNDGTGKKK